MEDFELEIKKDFLQEAKDLLESTEQSFLELEKDPDNKVLLDAIFRFAHNLKGTSRAVGFGQIAELTHIAENLLLAIKDGRVKVSDHVVSLLLVFNDKVREMIEGLSDNIEAVFDSSELMKNLEAALSGENLSVSQENNSVQTPSGSSVIEEVVTKNETTSSKEHEFITDEELERMCMANVQDQQSVCTTKSEKEAQKEIVKEAPKEMEKVATIPVQAKVETPKTEVVKKDAKKEDETIRVQLSRLSKLNDLVGELVILQALVEGSLSRYGEFKTARSLGKLCKDIQDLSMSLRMVPVGPTFQKLSRIVRDTSKILGKQVELKLIGEDTEIDKTVAESLGDPLVHIIRNAIDHGVESPQDRMNAGKSATGVVEVMAFHEGNFLVIQITDDGKGINGEILVEKAKKKGIIPSGAQFTEQQAIELIFHPGFSSKDEVSEVSGRGVGMDVVKTNIEDLGGEVKVRSRVGAGSCFRLILPLTLAIIEGMVVESGGQTLVIPKGQVQEVIRLDTQAVTKITGSKPYLTLRDEVIPLFSLEEDWGAIQKTLRNEVAIIVKSGTRVFAVGVSNISRQQQVVVKPPTLEIMGKAGVMGTTILGDGRPSMIVDLMELYSKVAVKENSNKLRAAA